MIELTATTAIMLYLCLTLMALFGIWGWHHLQSRKRKVILVEKVLNTCEYCHFAYLDEIAKEVSQCPQCHSFNKRDFH